MSEADRSTDLRPLLDLVARLRAPDGCPWDRAQELADVRAYLLEEAHELADAIDREDWPGLAQELGDLLFQAAFVARLAEERGAFDVASVLVGIHDKMVGRHPHVFGNETATDVGEVSAAWERRKVAAGKGSLLAGVPSSLPALLAAYRMTQKAAGVGFDWPDAEAVLDKVEEEIGELRQALGGGDPDRTAAREEVGDLLFTVANLARKLDLDPEAALAAANLKFRRRFRYIEQRLADTGRTLNDAGLEEMDALWEEGKRSARV